jgi:hypothetical protein
LTRNRTFAPGDPAPADWPDSLSEFIGSLAQGFLITIGSDPTTLQVVAGPDNDQVAIAINGRWRYNTATVTAASPGSGTARSLDVWVTATDNVFISGSTETDDTDYSFALVVVESGASPVGAVLSRKVGSAVWSGSVFTGVTQTVDAPPAHASTHSTGGSDPITPGAIGAATSAGLSAEVTRASSAEGALATAIAAEASRAEAAEPTAGELAALAGTSGAPGSGNKYVTSSDSRMTNSRTPIAHASSHAVGGGDTITGITAGQLATGACSSNVGVLGGDLSGSLPNPTIAAGAVTSSKLGTGLSLAGGMTVAGGCAVSSGGATITGPVSMSSTLGVSGATTLTSTLVVGGSCSLNSSLSVMGTASLSSGLTVAGGCSLASTLAVTGDATVSGVLYFKKNGGYPATGGAGALGWNFSGGGREVNFWNTDTALNPPSPAFDWRWQTGAAASTDLMTLSGQGALSTAGGVGVAGSASWTSGQRVEMLFAAGTGFVQAYDRGANSYLPLLVAGSAVTINATGATNLQTNGSSYLTAGATSTGVFGNGGGLFLGTFGANTALVSGSVSAGLTSGGATVQAAGGTATMEGNAGATVQCAGQVHLQGPNGDDVLVVGNDSLGFFGHFLAVKQTVNGSRGGNNALAGLLDALAAYGLITNSTSA